MPTVDSSSLLLVGDPHFSCTTPQTRIDDYPATTLRKLEHLLSIAKEQETHLVLFTGDVFHLRQQTVAYLSDLMSVLVSFRDAGIQLYSIVGNHDIAFNRSDTLGSSPLSLLFKSGLLHHLRNVTLQAPGYPVSISGFDYTDSIQPSPSDGMVSVCVAHRFYNYPFDPLSLHMADIETLGYDFYFLGHDHVSYPMTEERGRYILRPGAFLRGTSHRYNLEREVHIIKAKFNGDAEDPNIKFTNIPIDALPAERVFSSSVFSESSTTSSLIQMSESMESLLAGLSEITYKTSVFSILDGLDVPLEVHSCIERALQHRGILRHEGKNDEGI